MDAATAIASVIVGVLALLGLLLVLGLVQETGMAGLRRLVRRTPDEAPHFDFGGEDGAVAVHQANAEALEPTFWETDGRFDVLARIEEMYEVAAARGMQVECLDAAPGHHMLAVSGLGSWRILHREAGLHVLEHASADDGHSGDRETARVIVAPRDTCPTPDASSLADAARLALDSAPAANVVVRRYRSGPSPLVRDSARRGYRTGNLEQVLAGEFDLY